MYHEEAKKYIYEKLVNIIFGNSKPDLKKFKETYDGDEVYKDLQVMIKTGKKPFIVARGRDDMCQLIDKDNRRFKKAINDVDAKQNRQITPL